MPTPDVVVVDHYDSYTFNLVHLIAGVTGVVPRVVEHDQVSAADVLAHTHVVLSPGPGHPGNPSDFTVGAEVIARATRPVLGVCLGMQGLVIAYDGVVDRHPPAHGRVAAITHDGAGLFTGLPQGFAAVRYHSLAAITIPDALRVTARAEDGVVMGVQHRELPQYGVQFHPESILSEHGSAMIRHFLEAW
ncbi:anthranilate synthase component II [Nocardioides limicola]|uniref:anthranilate synthase component II n=1 Tax=Nocardioides limicola TaxID=2803368 RepID=UPI00193C48B2|nr:aminodeoxychorismate/anthranilate synthase component II [Nocardioides sp. DJM-14]